MNRKEPICAWPPYCLSLRSTANTLDKPSIYVLIGTEQEQDVQNNLLWCRLCLEKNLNRMCQTSGMVIYVASSMIVMEVTIYYYELTDVENTFHESGFSKEAIRVRTVAIIKE